MRKYSTRKIERNRYMELYYYAKRYPTLPERDKERLRQAIGKVVEERYADELLKGICFDVPYKSLDIPYSERAYSRLRNNFFCELDKIKR